MIHRSESLILLTLLSVIAVIFPSCHGDDVSGHIVGTWTSEWNDDLDGDLDEMTVDETLVFRSENEAGNLGVFTQVFEGSVTFDDWENESEVDYIVGVTGKWRVRDNDVVDMNYDLNSIEVKIGESNLEPDYTDAGVALLTGDLSGLISSAIDAEQSKKLNQKIEEKVLKGVTSYYKGMFRTINKDKEALTDVEITNNVMTCSVNHGTFGRSQSYDRLKTDEMRTTDVRQPSEASTGKNMASSYESVSAEDDSHGDVDAVSLTGTVAGQNVVMELSFSDGEVSGRYRYLKIQPAAWMSLEGTFDGERIEMYEYNPQGELCGSFDVRVFHNSTPKKLMGSMVNYKGKTYNVDLAFN